MSIKKENNSKVLDIKTKFYQNTWFIIALLILFFPVGIFLMAKYASWHPKIKWGVGIVICVLIILSLFTSYNAPPSLTLLNIQDTQTTLRTDDSTYPLQGTISSMRDVRLLINDQDVQVQSDNSFETTITLQEGDNTIKIEARNSNGSKITYIKIHRTTTEEFAERKRLEEEALQKAEAEALAQQQATEQKKAEDEKNSRAQQIVPTGNLYTVTSIVDGDTIKVSMDGKTVTIRFIGMDTPETKDPDKPVQCYGKEATSRMQHYVQSKKVRLAADSSQGDTDKYGRLLRYVFLEDGRNVAYEMIREGSAKEYTYNTAYQYQSQFKESQRLAQSEKQGLWATNTCNGNTTQAATPTTTTIQTATPAPAPTPAPTSSNCDPNYSPCIPNVSYDLNCPDIGIKVRIIGTDHHHFDNDNDRYGCDSY